MKIELVLQARSVGTICNGESPSNRKRRIVSSALALDFNGVATTKLKADILKSHK